MSAVDVHSAASTGGLEANFDIPFVARMALREKQVQQSYRPIISIHKWFARRPGSVFRALMLSEFVDEPLALSYFRSHDLKKTIADPMMGGGTSVFEATRLGMNVVGSDINPMAYWLVRQAVTPLDLHEFRRTAESVIAETSNAIGDLYRTTCTHCGSDEARVKYFLWVKTCQCPECNSTVKLFPGLRVAEAVRHPREVYFCPNCDSLRELDLRGSPLCPNCQHDLSRRPVHRGCATCHHCEAKFRFSEKLAQPPEHELYGIEYQCPDCYHKLKGRQFKSPDESDNARVLTTDGRLSHIREELNLPVDEIPTGDETNRLHRWGYHKYSDLFTSRQLLGLGLLMNQIRKVSNEDMRNALATVFSDFLRYQNLLCRYDTYALKCQDIFSVHGFPVSLLACENNLLGIPKVGSGSFSHFVTKFIRAKEYAQNPFETVYGGRTKRVIPMPGESIETPLCDSIPDSDQRASWIACIPGQEIALEPETLDAVFTDPPYFANVQYAELMDFCYVWLRRLLGDMVPEFRLDSTRSNQDLTGNSNEGRGLVEFTDGLSKVFSNMGRALKSGAPLAFTYHHNDPLAYAPLVVAILDAGLTCTDVLPTPGEMSASLHIAGTKSSILDSVFICRSPNSARAEAGCFFQVPVLVQRDAEQLRQVPYEPSQGDLACLRAGHTAAIAVRKLRQTWDSALPIDSKLDVATRLLMLSQDMQENGQKGIDAALSTLT